MTIGALNYCESFSKLTNETDLSFSRHSTELLPIDRFPPKGEKWDQYRLHQNFDLQAKAILLRI